MLLVFNWKTYLSAHEGLHLAESLARFSSTKLAGSGITCVIAPPTVMISNIYNTVAGSGIKVAAQDCSIFPCGANTGENSVENIWQHGCQYVLTGHSERRKNNGETNEIISQKSTMVCKANMIPIVCVGEKKVQNLKDASKSVIKQLEESAPKITEKFTHNHFIVAYEPVWAIGTNKSPTPEHISTIASAIEDRFPTDPEIPLEKPLILYGGSVNHGNCKEILSTKGIEGLLIGRAGLIYDEAVKILSAALQLQKK